MHLWKGNKVWMAVFEDNLLQILATYMHYTDHTLCPILTYPAPAERLGRVPQGGETPFTWRF